MLHNEVGEGRGEMEGEGVSDLPYKTVTMACSSTLLALRGGWWASNIQE